MITLERFTLFEFPVLINLSLSNFKEMSSFVTIQRYKNKLVLALDWNSFYNRNSINYPAKSMDWLDVWKNSALLYLSLTIILNTFILNRKRDKIIKWYFITLKSLEVVVWYLLANILFFINSEKRLFPFLHKGSYI